MRKQIPNLITCMNVISGTLAIFLAMYGLLTAAAILILVGMVFDFFFWISLLATFTVGFSLSAISRAFPISRTSVS